MPKHRFSKQICLLLLVLIFAINGLSQKPAIAQGTNCLKGLNAADCQLLEAMSANMEVPQSFNVTYDFSLQTVGFPRLGTATMSFKGTGVANLGGSTSDLSALLTQLQFATTMQLNLKGISNLNYKGQVDLRVVNGDLYFHNSQLNKTVDWAKVSLARLTDQLGDTRSLMTLFQYFTPANIKLLCQCTSVDVSKGKSQAGPKLDGKATKQISAVFDFGAAYDQLKTDQEKTQFLSELMVDFVGTTAIDFADAKQLAAAIKTMRASSLQYSWIVTPDDQMYHGFSFKINLSIDPVLLNLQNAGSAKTAATFKLQGSLLLSKIGREVNVPPGEGNVEDITEQMSQGLGSIR